MADTRHIPDTELSQQGIQADERRADGDRVAGDMPWHGGDSGFHRVFRGAGRIHGRVDPGRNGACRLYRKAHETYQGSFRRGIFRVCGNDDTAGAAREIYRTYPDNNCCDDTGSDDILDDRHTSFRSVAAHGDKRRLQYGSDRRILFYHRYTGIESGSDQ